MYHQVAAQLYTTRGRRSFPKEDQMGIGSDHQITNFNTGCKNLLCKFAIQLKHFSKYMLEIMLTQEINDLLAVTGRCDK